MSTQQEEFRLLALIEWNLGQVQRLEPGPLLVGQHMVYLMQEADENTADSLSLAGGMVHVLQDWILIVSEGHFTKNARRLFGCCVRQTGQVPRKPSGS